jgi:hypothetical protein
LVAKTETKSRRNGKGTDDPMKIRQSWVTAALWGATALFKQCRKNANELVKIQTAMVYLKGVEILRDLLFYQMGIQVCVVFLVFGVILMQGGVLFYFPLSPQARATTALLLGALDSLTAFSFLAYFSSSKRWLKQAARYNLEVEDIIEKNVHSDGNGTGGDHRTRRVVSREQI